VAKTKGSNTDLLTGAAEMVGGALGTVAGTIDRLRADHPDPVQEAKEALAAGEARLTGLAAEARNRTSAVVEATKAAVKKVRRGAAQSRGKSSKITKKAKQAARKTVKRGKKVVGRARKAAVKGRARARRART
jgi:hypothetical protein